LVSRLVSVTVAFGTEEPEESFNVPEIAPVEADWLNIDGARTMEKQIKRAKLNAPMRLLERMEGTRNIVYLQYFFLPAKFIFLRRAHLGQDRLHGHA
jgi:hypothetical protein